MESKEWAANVSFVQSASKTNCCDPLRVIFQVQRCECGSFFVKKIFIKQVNSTRSALDVRISHLVSNEASPA